MDPINATGSSGTQATAVRRCICGGPGHVRGVGGRHRALDGRVVRAQRRLHRVDADPARGPGVQRRHPVRRRGGAVQLGAGAEPRQPVAVVPGGRRRSRLMEVVDAADPRSTTLAGPNAHFDSELSAARHQLHRLPDRDPAGDPANQPVGAGPFLIESWTRDDRMVFVRNPDYFDAPRPYLDSAHVPGRRRRAAAGRHVPHRRRRRLLHDRPAARPTRAVEETDGTFVTSSRCPTPPR